MEVVPSDPPEGCFEQRASGGRTDFFLRGIAHERMVGKVKKTRIDRVTLDAEANKDEELKATLTKLIEKSPCAFCYLSDTPYHRWKFRFFRSE